MTTNEMPGVPLVRAVERAAAILRAFTRETPKLTLGEVSRRSGLGKSTTRRLLNTMRLLDWVEFQENTQTYTLGIGLLTFIPVLGFGRDIGDIAAPILAQLSEETDATSFLWIFFRGEAMCIDRVRAGNVSIGSWSTVGTRVPLHCGGGPRVVLAYQPEEVRKGVLDQPLRKHTPRTETDPRQLDASCAQIRSRGWELAADDHIVGLSGLGVPVLNYQGAFVASISISTVTPQLPLIDGKPKYLETVKQAANEISARLERK